MPESNKRLEQLRRQVYGSTKDSEPTNQQTDTMHLRQDLTKIAFLSSLALGAQFLLYLGLKNNLVKLPI